MKHHFSPLRLLVALACLQCAIPGALCQQPPTAAEEAAQRAAWENCKADLEAKGEHLDIKDFIPPPVPDEKNFALTPLLKPLLDLVPRPEGGFVPRDPDPPVRKISAKIPDSKATYPSIGGWQTGNTRKLDALQAYYRASLPGMALSKSPAEDVLAVFGRFDAMFAELRREREARPLSRYPLHYESPLFLALPHLSMLQQMITVLSLRASAELALNHPDDAFADLQLGFGLIDSFRGEKVLISGLVRITTTQILLQPIWEGIAAHRWKAEQLAGIEKQLQQWNFLSDCDQSIRLERAYINWVSQTTIDDPKSLENSLDQVPFASDEVLKWPKATIYSSRIVINTLIQEKFLPIIDEKKQIVNVAAAKELENYAKKIATEPSTFIAKTSLPVYISVMVKFVQAQIYVNEAIVACEIERYRLAHGKLPDTLEALQMQSMPHDVIGGQPLHYRLDGEDNYFLYSVGWDETDDAGKLVFKINSVLDYSHGDWVWTLKPVK